MTAPSDRDKIITKVAEAMCNADKILPVPWEDLSEHWRDHYRAMATAAFDALVEAWAPPW